MSSFVVPGFSPPVPAGRDFDLLGMLPAKNRDEDSSGDLARFVSLCQELTGLQLYDVDRFTQIADPSLADEQYVLAMLDDLGDPFDPVVFPLSLTDERRLVLLLVAMYGQKGTNPGIINVVRFFMGLTITITEIGFGGWILGVSLLDHPGTTLGTSDPALRNTFDVNVTVTLTPVQVQQLTAIVDYMKPAWTHFRRINQPGGSVRPSPWQLDVTRIDTGVVLI